MDGMRWYFSMSRRQMAIRPPRCALRIRGLEWRSTMNTSCAASSVCAVILAGCFAGQAIGADRVKIANGELESTTPAKNGVRSFKGIPFGQPPVGGLRWREPQPVKNWTGVRNADKFGPRCMQRTSPNNDYWFRGDGMSEDCLYLNVWTP